MKHDYASKKAVGAYFGASFLLHLLWENLQMPLFEIDDASKWQIFKMCLWATVTGDLLFMLVIYLIVAVIHKLLCWIANRTIYSHPATWVVPVIVGVLLAVSFKLWVVYTAHRWKYASMPLIPLIRVGITPVLQMALVPLTVLALCKRIARTGRTN